MGKVGGVSEKVGGVRLNEREVRRKVGGVLLTEEEVS